MHIIELSNVPEEIAAAIDAYLKSLKAVQSPHLVHGKLSQSAERGKEIFDDAGCIECHKPPLFSIPWGCACRRPPLSRQAYKSY